MKTQRSQKKKKKKKKEKLSEAEISNLPDREFKEMIIKMLKELGGWLDKHSEKFNKELENIKNQTEWKKTINEIKNTRRNQQ